MLATISLALVRDTCYARIIGGTIPGIAGRYLSSARSFLECVGDGSEKYRGSMQMKREEKEKENFFFAITVPYIRKINPSLSPSIFTIN